MITHRLIVEEWEKHKSLDKARRVKKLNKAHGNGQVTSELLPDHIHTEHIDN
jgi:hypothetical protein